MFLLIGFVVDGLGWYQHMQYLKTTAGTMDLKQYESNAFYFDLMRRTYGLLEALFFLWFIFLLSREQLSKMIKWSVPLVVLSWVLFEIMFPFGLLQNPLRFELAYFQAIYRVLAAFFGGFALLQLVEYNLLDAKSGLHWLLFGVFMYNLATFFIMLLQRVPLGEKLWYLHNSVNMLSYLIYARGFILIIKATTPKSNFS